MITSYDHIHDDTQDGCTAVYHIRLLTIAGVVSGGTVVVAACVV